MRPIFTIDCETDPFLHGRFPQPFLWGIYDGASYQQFERTEDVADFVRDTNGIFYAHNGGRFDYHFLLDYADDYTDVMLINGRLAKWNLGQGELRDSYNILPIALKDYKKDDFDYTLMEREQRNKIAVREKIEEYLKHDCQYLHELVSGFILDHGLHLTQAAASLSRWRKQSGVTLPDTDGNFFDIFKPFYFGGRVQAFKMGVGNTRFKIADVKSAYPRAMLETHPFGERIERVGKEVLEPQYFYRVDCVANGCFPLRGEDGRLHYPRDNQRRSFAVTGWELIAAQECGLLKHATVTEILRVRGQIDFKDFIMDLWRDRKDAEEKGDAQRKLFDKLLMNSCYGKLGADPRNYFNHFIMPREDAPVEENGKYELSGYIGKWALLKDLTAANFSRFYCVATAASITGYQRAVMMRQIPKCRGLLYCDTDSLAAEDFGDIDSGSDLGQWEISEDIFDRYAIGGRKVYAFRAEKACPKNNTREGFSWYNRHEYKVASKGVRLNVEDIIRVAKGEMVTYEPQAPTYSLHRGARFINREISMVEDASYE